MKNIYNLFLIIIFHTILPIISIFFKRIKFWIFIQRKKTALKIQTITKKRIWFHCASVGEYEMIKPIIKYYEVEKNEIIISFFSALAYSHIKNNSNYNCFLFPLDTSYNINETIKKINPKKVIIAKNEIWPNFIISCYKNSIPTYLIATKIKDSRLNNLFYGKLYCSLLSKITGIFVVDENSKKALREKNINSMISGDPRVDQVLYEKKINRKAGNVGPDPRLFLDLGDSISFEQSMRNFYSTPNTKVCNDQTAFAKYLYGEMPSCKEGNEFQCMKDNYRYTLF